MWRGSSTGHRVEPDEVEAEPDHADESQTPTELRPSSV